MTKTIYLVRHGQTYFNYYHKVQGRCDSPLNERGIRQVEKTRDYFKENEVKFDKAFSSTQERASDTLEIITDHQMPYSRLKDLREKSYGIFEGRDEFLLPWNYGNTNVDPTMEPNEEVVARMKRGVREVLDNIEDEGVETANTSRANAVYRRNVSVMWRGMQARSFLRMRR